MMQAWSIRWAVLYAVALAAGMSPAGSSERNIPANRQDGTSDCGPAAAASGLKWFQEHGYSELKAGNGGNGLKDYEDQLEAVAGTDESGTWAHKLRDAIGALIDGTPYKGQLRAKGVSSNDAYKNFDFLDTEFSHNENILLLMLAYKNNQGKEVDHFITVKNITGTGDSRTVEYMDPASATFETSTMQIGQDGYLRMPLGGKDARLSSITSITPANTTTSTSAPANPSDPSAGTNITYTMYYPSFRPTKDLHVWVSDCTKANYSISGLPLGWQWDVKRVGNKCYLSSWKNSSSQDIPNGGSFTVNYKGQRKVRDGARVVTPSTGGTADPADSAQPVENGQTVASVFPENPPGRPAHAALTLMDRSPVSVSELLTWDAVPDPSVSHYEVYERNTRELMAETNGTQWPLVDLGADVMHEFTVAARNADVLLSDDSNTVSVYLDAAGSRELLPGGPQEIRYVPALYSGDAPVEWRMTLPGAVTPGRLYVLTLTCSPGASLPSELGSLHEHHYHLFADVQLNPGPIDVAVHYDTVDVRGREAAIRLLAFVNGQWNDVTTHVDPASNLVSGALPELTTLAIVNGPPDTIPTLSEVALVLLVALLLVAGIFVMQQLRTQGAA